jgi:gluconokinase
MGRTDVGAVLALDVGTSSCRASLYEVATRRVTGRVARSTYSPMVTADGGAELDAEVLFEKLCGAIDTVLEGNPRVVGVGISTFWHSLLGVDASGRALTPVYLWMDARSRGEVAGLRAELDERDVHGRVGTVLHWSYWPAKLRWLQRTQPEVVSRVARWVSFGEMAQQRLTGQTGISVSMASGTGLLNTHACDWDAGMLVASGVDRAHLGQVIPLTRTSSLSSRAAERWPALRDVPWVAAVGDGACSNLGAGCATPERFAVMIGTSGAERVVWAPPDPFEVPWGTWCYRVDERRVVIGGALNDGGSLFDWLRASLRLPALTTAEADVAALDPDAHGLSVLPFWAGERSPGWADDARGAIVGLRLHTRPVEILRACLEAVALRFGELDRILLETMPSGREVVATGGALLHSPAWMQILADVLGRPLLASTEAEASSRGVALLVLETLGLLDRPLEDIRPVGRRRVAPRPAHTARYRAAAERQRRLYDALVS